MRDELQPLLNAVQRNCHISDARYAGDYTLCIYLLKMREYFRWEKGYAFGDNLPESDLGEWLRQREDYWQEIEDEAFAELPIDGEFFDPFDNAAINAALNPYGLVYSGGFGSYCTPHFFLGRLGHRENRPDFTVFVSENEYARDLTAPPAMALDGTIYVRRESLRRMIWEKIEEWRWNRLENAMARALRDYDIDTDTEAALETLTDTLAESVLLHEKGEVLAGKLLGKEWEAMLAELPRSKAEIMLRAVRDHLADALTTLPALLAHGADASLHFFFANLAGMRRLLAPTLMQAYDGWAAGGARGELEQMLPAYEAHWRELAARILETRNEHPGDFSGRVQALAEHGKF